MATYNGSDVIQKQLKSILKQLQSDDEVVITDDNSSDETIKKIKQLDDKRIKIKKNEVNSGPIKCFEDSLKRSHGDIIFLSDQDDIWADNKVSRVTNIFKQDQVKLIIHDAIVENQYGKILNRSWNDFNQNKFHKGMFSIIVKNPFCGAMMAFKKDILPLVLPFPKTIPMHDVWIGIECERNSIKYKAIPDKLIHYVRRTGNVTGGAHKPGKMISNRIGLVLALFWEKIK
ncbi:glycosyltransferase [Pediococcus ethanolidurans]|uniref:glycosyltransferase n=1 Tax=Pediococcus ethanolidurans TaxID=319653 RepID=UPI00345E1F95